jgi:hypothetical protein
MNQAIRPHPSPLCLQLISNSHLHRYYFSLFSSLCSVGQLSSLHAQPRAIKLVRQHLARLRLELWRPVILVPALTEVVARCSEFPEAVIDHRIDRMLTLSFHLLGIALTSAKRPQRTWLFVYVSKRSTCSLARLT